MSDDKNEAAYMFLDARHRQAKAESAALDAKAEAMRATENKIDREAHDMSESSERDTLRAKLEDTVRAMDEAQWWREQWEEEDRKTRDALGPRFTLELPDGGDVKTHEAAARAISALSAAIAERDQASRYLRSFLCSFVSQHFPDNPDWKPLPDLLGMLTQIDNASTIARDYRAAPTLRKPASRRWRRRWGRLRKKRSGWPNTAAAHLTPTKCQQL
jgi:hypothetical protein